MLNRGKLCVHVGGARGVGKGALLNSLLQGNRFDMPVHLLPVSSSVFQLGREQFKREWSELADDEKYSIRQLFIEKVIQFPEGLLILDSHYVDVLPDGRILSIIPTELYPLIDCHVVVCCRADTLLLRRTLDALKTRLVDRRLVERELRGELVVARRISRATQRPFHLVANEENVGCGARCLGDTIDAQWSMSIS